MRINALIAAASALALTNAQSLVDVLSGQDNLSTLTGLLTQFPDIADFILAQKDVTLLAPTDDAFAKILATGGIFSIDQAEADAGLIEQILRYHLIRGAVPSSAITPASQFVPTFLNYSSIVLDGEVSGSNVTGGQVVGVNVQDGGVVVTSGIKAESNVVKADLEFDNGGVHTIHKLLTIPLSIAVTLLTGNFTALAGAAVECNILNGPTGLEEVSDITIFAPNNDAFMAIASATESLSLAQLTSILGYHVVPGVVAYSTDLGNTSLPTTQGSDLEITVTPEGAAFVDGARIINTDIFVPGGVIHIIDQVLSPATNDKQPTEVEFPADAAGTFVPFTSEFPPATTTYAELAALAATTSFVAAPSSAAMGGNGSAMASGSMTMSASGMANASGAVPAQQTGNAGVRKEMPFLSAAVVVAAAAFAMDL